MSKRLAILGDATTTGGKIISATGYAFEGLQNIAMVGDYASCPKCKSSGIIINGTYKFIVDGKQAAYDGCMIACQCSPVGSNKIIALKGTMFVDEPSDSGPVSLTPRHFTPTSYVQNDLTTQYFDAKDKISKIRLDAQHLLDCAQDVCKKHLYHSEIKQAFIDDVGHFANNIVDKVETGTMSYEQGSAHMKQEELSLWDQSIVWIQNGLSFFGGVGMFMAGLALCETGFGCMIGAPLMAHGFNGIYEGSAGIYNGVMNKVDEGNRRLNVEGPLRKVYQSSAKTLGFNPYVGDLAYDLFDIAASVHGKLKLVPKLNELGNPRFKLFQYGKADLERAYKQMSNHLLVAEIVADALSLSTIEEDIKNAFVLDKETNQVSMVVSEPKSVINVKQIVENCHLVITITGVPDEDSPGYFLCESPDGSKYTKEYN